MSHATGAKWSKDESRFGKQLMQKAGWTEGKGLGRNEDGVTDNVKTLRKGDVLGIGYEGQVQQTWSTQSVGFADVLKRINQSPTPQPGSDAEDDDGEADEMVFTATSPTTDGPRAGKHAAAYTKRRNLKTEALRSVDGKAEVLGAAASSIKRGRGDDSEDEDHPADDQPSLASPLLLRLMCRVPKHEPRPCPTTSANVVVTKPDPRPPRPSDTPFYA